MERVIASRRLWAGVALELMPYALFRMGTLLELAWHRSDLLYNIGGALFFVSLVSGLGWIAVGYPAGGLAAFTWRALFVTITGAALWMYGEPGDPLWWWVKFGWFATMAFPAVSAALLWRWVHSVEHDDFSDDTAVGAPNPSAKSA
ncbi:MAG: hypothetical protein EPO22_01460 [Dehalococcoidia bacterium]|nr:MAG: hypothetical protein EPO22_01460 [Dehalococcoidia bacterium]